MAACGTGSGGSLCFSRKLSVFIVGQAIACRESCRVGTAHHQVEWWAVPTLQDMAAGNSLPYMVPGRPFERFSPNFQAIRRLWRGWTARTMAVGRFSEV